MRAVITSFDPSQRGWLTYEQISQVFLTLGLPLDTSLLTLDNNKMTTNQLLIILRQYQEEILMNVFLAGINEC